MPLLKNLNLEGNKLIDSQELDEIIVNLKANGVKISGLKIPGKNKTQKKKGSKTRKKK